METNVIKIESVKKNRKGEKGVTTVEYAVMLVGVAIAVYLGISPLTTAIKAVFTKFTSVLAV